MLGYKWKRARLSLRDKRDQAQFDRQQAELEQLKELHETGHIDLYYCDQSLFGLTPNVCSAWQQKDRPILLHVDKGQRLSVFGLMTPDCKLFSWMVEGSINSDLRLLFSMNLLPVLPERRWSLSTMHLYTGAVNSWRRSTCGKR